MGYIYLIILILSITTGYLIKQLINLKKDFNNLKNKVDLLDNYFVE